MFTPDATIDLIQTGKKNFVSTVFANQEKVAEALNGFVDAQTAYTKAAFKATQDSATKLTSEAVKMTQEAAKFDFTKATEAFTKAFTAAKK